MTAEIAIVNRSSVTLAADSAMSLSVGGRKKIYASTDKIFELSERDAIGLMIYNNLEFMGAPIDVLIKHFRGTEHCCAFESIADSADSFFSYLLESWPHTVDSQKRHAAQIVGPIYAKLRRDFDNQITELVSSKKRAHTPKFFSLLIACVAKKVTELERYSPAECFAESPESEIEDFYADVLDGIIDQAFRSPPLNADERTLCRRVGVLALHRDTFSEMLTGFVFAGYGRGELFPSLRSYHTDGIIAGKLKTKMIENFATNREKITARIIPFAQREMVDRFLFGIDPSLERGINRYFAKAAEATKRDLFNGVGNLDAKSKRKILENLRGSLGIAVSDFSADFLSKTKTSYSKQTEDMVVFMAKQESAHLAEALVNITSVKRKYSPGEESVAGPIDVAVISRNDGFVWVKRKHYFPAELNQRYAVRKFGNVSFGKGGNDVTTAGGTFSSIP